jgi:hypothetical protein
MRNRSTLPVAPYLVAVAVACGCGGSGRAGDGAGPRDGGADTTTGTVADTGAPINGVESGSVDSSTSFFPDATYEGSAPDSAACMHLNIGILGNPGQNASSDFQQWLVNAGTSVQRIQTMAPTPVITAATLQPFDVVILDWLTRDYSAAEAAVFASFVISGGGVVAMSGYDNVTADDWHANSLLAPLAVAYSGPLLLDGPVTDFAMHPITAGLTSVTFDGGYAISDLGGTSGTRTPIAFLANPQAAGNVTVSYAIQMGSGHAFVWGDEWISFDSEWSTMPEIEQLWVQVFAWISPKNRCALMPPQ